MGIGLNVYWLYFAINLINIFLIINLFYYLDLDCSSYSWYNINMSKQRMIVTDDQLLIDMDLLFNSIREADGDWEKVEQEMQQYLAAVQSMVEEQ